VDEVGGVAAHEHLGDVVVVEVVDGDRGPVLGGEPLGPVVADQYWA
jgi:hypothetical protein